MDRLTPRQAIQTAEMALAFARRAKLEEYARLEPATAELALQSALQQVGQHAEAARRVPLEKQPLDVARSTAPKNSNKERGPSRNVAQP
jgi:hypothetical protein